MNANISDRNVLLAVSPMALSAYARTAGWAKVETYGEHSDVYAGQSLPEIIIPRTHQLGDYASVVARLIGIFARVAEVGEATLYNDLITADRDVIRARAVDVAGDGTVDLSSGVKMVRAARDLVLAIACSLSGWRPFYRIGANREANEFLRRMRLGQTEQGSFVVTLLTPTILPLDQDILSPDHEIDTTITTRRVTLRLAQALTAARGAVEIASGGDANAFSRAVTRGVSANLCEALVDLIEPFPALDISITWARTYRMSTPRQTVSFTGDDAPILRAAAQSFRSRESQPDVRLTGSVRILRRDESERDGTVTIRASVNGGLQSVTATLTQSDYDRAVQAHAERWPVVVAGDLERIGQRWHLHGPRIVAVISDVDDPEDEEQ